MPELEETAPVEERRYWELVRQLANAPEEVKGVDVDSVTAAARRTRDQLHEDVGAALERRRLLIASGALLNLEVSCEVAAEGYRSGQLSIGQVAELLGLGVIQAEAFLRGRGVNLNHSAADLQRDTETVNSILDGG